MTNIPNSTLKHIAGYFSASLFPHPEILNLSERSWKQVSSLIGESTCLSQYESLVNNYQIYELLPTQEEWQKQLLLTQEVMGLPYHILHISFSRPVMYPQRLSLSSLLKLYDSEKRLQVRIKLSCFSDQFGQLWWEVGFVHVSKSIDRAYSSALPQKQSYYLLSKLLANFYAFMQQRSFVNGIHLSPAFYHIWPLSLRMASQYPNTIIENVPVVWLQQLNAAFADNEIRSALKIKTNAQRQFCISQMLEKQLLSHPITKTTLHWHPPAIVILR